MLWHITASINKMNCPHIWVVQNLSVMLGFVVFSLAELGIKARPRCVLQIPADLHIRKGLGLTLMKVRSLLSKMDIIKISIEGVPQMFNFQET